MKIRVTREDIERGKRTDSCRCPVARAVRRATRKKFVAVGVEDIDVGSQVTVPTPSIVATFIRAFDARRPVQPFAFDLEVPRE